MSLERPAQVEKLTADQYETACSLGKKLHDGYLIGNFTSMGQAREWIEWLYRWANRPKPEIVFVLNPTRMPSFRESSDIAAKALQAMVDERGRYISETYSWDIRKLMYRLLFDQRNKHFHEVIGRAQWLWLQERDSDNVWVPSASSYSSFSLIDRGAIWVADAYREIDPQFQVSEFYTKASEFAMFGLFGICTGENECWALRLPSTVSVDPGRGVPHSDSGPAVVWLDDYEQYYLHGVQFPVELWYGVVTKSIPLKEIEQWSNMDRVKAALSYLGPEFFLAQSSAALIDASASGNKLYSINSSSLLGNIKILAYACPSTGKAYHKFVVNWLNDADEAQAWRHGLSKRGYGILKES